MAGLDLPARPKPLRRGEGPAIHRTSWQLFLKMMDARVMPAHDEEQGVHCI